MLSAQGMRTWAIAPVVGVNDSRVRQIKREVGSGYPPASAEPITGQVYITSDLTADHPLHERQVRSDNPRSIARRRLRASPVHACRPQGRVPRGPHAALSVLGRISL